MRAFLSVTDHDTIRVHDFDGQVPDAEARTQDELVKALAPYIDAGCEGFQFSSSMDFPEEDTSDPVLLETVEWIMESV